MDFKEQALNEYNSEEFMVRPGGVNGRGFWNINATQFMYTPSFSFPTFPKANGYQSLHLVLVDTKGRYLEIQVRTLDMHAAIESGIANHEDYKKIKYNLDFPISREKIELEGYKFINNHLIDFETIENPGTVFERQTL